MSFTVTDQLSALSTAGGTVSLPVASAVAIGSLIVLVAMENNTTGNPGTLTDSAGNTYVRANNKSPNNAIANGASSIFYCLSTTAALTTSSTWTFTKATSGVLTCVAAISATYGAGTTCTLDVNATPTTGSSTAPSISATGTSGTELYVAGLGIKAGAAGLFTQAGGWSNGPDFLNGTTSVIAVAGGNLLATGAQTWAPGLSVSRNWACFLLVFREVAGNVTLTCANGAYALTGEPATFGMGTPMTGGVYSLTGRAATFGEGGLLGSGAYALTGFTAMFPQTIPLAGGVYALSGFTATFSQTTTASLAGGAYALTGFSTTFPQTISSAGSVYALTGFPVTFSTVSGITLVGATGVYTLTGEPAGFRIATGLGTGAYALTGMTAAFVSGAGVITPCVTGVYALTGEPATFPVTVPLILACEGGRYTCTGYPVTTWTRDPLPVTLWMGECPVTVPPRWMPAGFYITEDGALPYGAEDGTAVYVQEAEVVQPSAQLQDGVVVAMWTGECPVTIPSRWMPIGYYITEDGASPYGSEDSGLIYVQEQKAA